MKDEVYEYLISYGFNKENLEIYNYPFTSLVGTIVSANKIEFAKSFMKSLVEIEENKIQIMKLYLSKLIKDLMS